MTDWVGGRVGGWLSVRVAGWCGGRVTVAPVCVLIVEGNKYYPRLPGHIQEKTPAVHVVG